MIMMKENIEEMLWKYVDGSCSDEESVHIQSLIEEDIDVAQLFKVIQTLDSGLQTALVQTAPVALKQNILAKVQTKPILQLAQFKIVPFMLLILALLALTVFFLPSQTPSTSYLASFDWSMFEWNLNLPQGYSVYILGALAAVALIWIDGLFGNKIRLT